MLKIAFRGTLLAALLSLSGCLLTTPHHGTVLPSRTEAVPFQAWTTKSGNALRVQCMPTNRYGPDISSHGSWSPIGTLPVSGKASRDSQGARIHSASASLSLPESCWYFSHANGWYYTSVRVRQSNYLSTANYSFYTLAKQGDRDDPACVGEAVGRTGNWSAWLSTSCYYRHASGEPVRWIVMRTRE